MGPQYRPELVPEESGDLFQRAGEEVEPGVTGESPEGRPGGAPKGHPGADPEGNPRCAAGGAGIGGEDDPWLDGDDSLVVLEEEAEEELEEEVPRPPKLSGVGRPKSKGKRRVPAAEAGPRTFTPAQRLLILEAWIRSGLPAGDFAPLVGISKHSLFAWRKRFKEEGPAGLEDRPRPILTGSKVDEVTRRAILLMKEDHPDWGEDRLHDMLLRSQGLKASPGAIGRVLAEAGYVVEEQRAKPHAVEPKRFERAKPNQLWQTDLFTFVLRRQNRRVYLVAFMDDHSRFVVGYGLHASASGAMVRETLERAIASYGQPEEVLTDNGPQYVTWRGKSGFTKLCERRGIKQIVARPKRPQTLGKIERMWGSLWRELLESAVFRDIAEAHHRIGLYFDHHNFHRTHQGIDGLVPADRYFQAAPEVQKTLLAQVAKNAFQLARDGLPRKPFYLTGRVGDVGISLHAEGEKVVLTRDNGERETVDLGASGARPDPTAGQAPTELPPAVTTGVLPLHAGEGDADGDEVAAPGTSPLDGVLEDLERGLDA